jgi:hypothetical protein
MQKKSPNKPSLTFTKDQKDNVPVFTVKGDRTPVPDAEYTANITDVEFTTFRNVRPCLKLSFEISEGEYTGRQLLGWINADPKNPNVTSNTKLARWYSVATNTRISDKDTIDPKNFIDKVVVVKTKTNRTKFNNDFSNVEDILRHVTDIGGMM